MAFKLNRELLPVKAHFFLFFAALGPILPQLHVFGKQLGVSPGVMGLVTSVQPLLWATAKPLFGYVVDYFTNQRKLVFMLLITVMTGSYCCLWILPQPHRLIEHTYTVNNTVYVKNVDKHIDMDDVNGHVCRWDCAQYAEKHMLWFTNTSFIGTVYVDGGVGKDTCGLFGMDFNRLADEDAICVPRSKCALVCARQAVNDTAMIGRNKRALGTNVAAADTNGTKLVDSMLRTKAMGHDAMDASVSDGLYSSATFWGYVVLMCVGTVAFNVANCISDAVCFDVLGPERGNKYGYQRALGTIGYGITALLGGWLMDAWSSGDIKNFTPAFILALVFTFCDLIACRRLKLPSLSSPTDSGRSLRAVLRMPRVLVFIAFAVVAGSFDSFIIYYMFWYLEELAAATGQMDQIKLLEGVIVAAQSFIGELLFFFFSGKILKKWGHGATMTFCLFCYGVRLAMISFITQPWHLVFIEAIMQGPTYALCYATIVGYAAEVAPEGYSATVQGIVAGMDDGLGFALGSLLGSVLYTYLGGAGAFRIMSLVGLLASIVHALLFKLISQKKMPAAKDSKDDEETIPEGEKMLHEPSVDNAVYRDTVMPLTVAKQP